MAIFGLREETTLQARLRDCLFPQTSEPDSRFCLFSLRSRLLAAEYFFHEWFKQFDPKPAAGGLTIVYPFRIFHRHTFCG